MVSDQIGEREREREGGEGRTFDRNVLCITPCWFSFVNPVAVLKCVSLTHSCMYSLSFDILLQLMTFS
jgi:hypothetical protein